jgi:diguanylate cyclase (GGDEF)-like protein
LTNPRTSEGKERRAGDLCQTMRDQLRHALLIAAAVSGVAVLAAFAFYEKPGLGLGHFFYVSIILAALATGPAIGAGAAAVATAMFAAGVVINPNIPPSEVLTSSTAIRFVTYMTVGVVTGYFAKRNRILMTELQLLADRDALTGLPNTRAFERAIGERLGQEQPFALIVGDVDAPTHTPGNEQLHADDVLREVASRLMHSLLPGDEVARVGDDEFAVLTHAASARDAGKIAAHLQRVLAGDGFAVTFGWAAYPQDGSNALSLYRAADERLYALRVIHRQPRVIPLPASDLG